MNESNSPKNNKKNDIPRKVNEEDYNDSSSFLKTSLFSNVNPTLKFSMTLSLVTDPAVSL